MRIHLLVGIRTVAVCAKCSTDKDEASNHTFFSLWVFRCGFYYVLPQNSEEKTSLWYVC